MKKLLYIPLFVVILLTSCTVEEGESNYYKTGTGFNVFLQIESNISGHLFLVDMANRVNLYTQSTEEKRKCINQNYLPGYTIIQAGNLCILENQDNYWEFESNGKKLDEPGAQWSITLAKKREDGRNIPLIVKENFMMKNIGNNEWAVYISDLITGIHRLADLELSEYNTFIWQNLDQYNKISTNFTVRGRAIEDDRKNRYSTYTIIGEKGQITNGISINYELPTVEAVFSTQSDEPDIYRMQSGDMFITVKLKDAIEDKINVFIVHNNRIRVIVNGIEETYF